MAEDTFIAAGAKVIGEVVLEKGSSVWYNVVLRGDLNQVVVGEYSNIQDNSTVHVDLNNATKIGRYVTVGHSVVLHGCTIEDYCLIGMGSVIMDGAVIGCGSVVGAGAVITKNTIIPPLSLVIGMPAKVIKTLDEDVTASRRKHAEGYYQLSLEYKKTPESK